jgi:DNA-binding MarR family transcriptional regulator
VIDKELDDIAEAMLQFFPMIKVLFKGGGSNGTHTPFRSQTYHILGMLKGAGPLPMSVIGKRLLIAKQNMTTMADRLIEEGLVERQPHPKDRRVTNVAITEKGIEVLRQGKQDGKEAIRRNLSMLSGEDIHALHSSFAVITAIFDKIRKESSHA